MKNFGGSTGDVGLHAIAAGPIAQSDVLLLAVDGAGPRLNRVGSTLNATWTSWAQFDQPNAPNLSTGFSALAIGRRADNRVEVLAIGNGEVFHAPETSKEVFSKSWRRFYGTLP